jgi:hypothetical protein
LLYCKLQVSKNWHKNCIHKSIAKKCKKSV